MHMTTALLQPKKIIINFTVETVWHYNRPICFWQVPKNNMIYGTASLRLYEISVWKWQLTKGALWLNAC